MAAPGFSRRCLLMELPMEVMEFLLLKIFAVLFARRLRRNGRRVPDAEREAYDGVACVCSYWHQTLNGWPQSDTRHWMKHRIQRLIRHLCRPYRRRPSLVQQLTVDNAVLALTQMNDNIYVLTYNSTAITVFGSDDERLPSIRINDLQLARDLVADDASQLLYVADWWSRDYPGRVWRVAPCSGHVDEFPLRESPTSSSSSSASSFQPRSLSVTSRRLLVTTDDDELRLFGPDGAELLAAGLVLPGAGLRHAVETSRHTFVVCRSKPRPEVCEIDVDGHVIGRYDDPEVLKLPCYVAVDSSAAVERVIVADYNGRAVLLLDGELRLERVLLDGGDGQLIHPLLLCCGESGRLVVGSGFMSRCIQVFQVRQR